ncbi:hypothetical protein [Streptomyces qinglanensis]|uniref:hypothetical protein n=1 Tax=Streptomyces qinglanensis TaxID=943816 RepID=UPI003D7564BC
MHAEANGVLSRFPSGPRTNAAGQELNGEPASPTLRTGSHFPRRLPHGCGQVVVPHSEHVGCVHDGHRHAADNGHYEH